MSIPEDRAPLVCSQRLTHAILSFFGKLFIYSSRVNLSLALLCMVRNDVSNSNATSQASTSISTSNPNGLFNNITSVWLDSHNDVNSNYSNINITPQGLRLIRTTNSSREDEESVDNEYSLSLSSGDDDGGGGEFDWDKSMQSHLLSMYFYGYIFTQIPSGWLASRFGGKKLWGLCQLVGSVCTIFTPLCARTHYIMLCAVRFILGFVSGVTFPCAHALMGRWAPPLDRTKLISISFSGPTVGLIVTLAVSGFLCAYGFDQGWGSIFYLCGIFNLMWVVAWFYLAADSPAVHRRITRRERDYIQNSIGKGVADRRRKVPWVKILTSGPMWAVVFGSFCNNYINYTMVTSLPMFMKEAMGFDIKQNGVLSSLPFVTKLVGGLATGYVADKVVQKRWLRVKTTRKLFQCSSLVVVAILFIVLIQIDAAQRHVAVLLLCLCTFFRSLHMAGYAVNHLDLAPRFAGLLFGITNTTGTIPGIIAPVIAGALTPNKTVEEWRNVFYVCAAVCVMGAVAYGILADGELQPWAMSEEKPGDTVVVRRNDTLQEDLQDNESESPRMELMNSDHKDVSKV